MALDQIGIDLLKAEACDRELTTTPCIHLMPNFDALAETWLHDAEIPNGSICDEFSIFCDLEDKSTYAIIRQIGGFFRAGTIFAAGMAIDSSSFTPDPDYQAEDKISIAGYRWAEDGATTYLSNTSTIEDELNEAWADCDDWLFGPLFFWGINPDGTIDPPPPPGFCYAIEEDGTKELQPLPRREEIEEQLLSIGFEHQNDDTEMLERIFRES